MTQIDALIQAKQRIAGSFEIRSAGIIGQAHNAVALAFDAITDDDGRDFIKTWLATDPMIKRTESAVSEQYRIGCESEDKEVRSRCLGNIEAGMRYWQELIARKIRGVQRS